MDERVAPLVLDLESRGCALLDAGVDHDSGYLLFLELADVTAVLEAACDLLPERRAEILGKSGDADLDWRVNVEAIEAEACQCDGSHLVLLHELELPTSTLGEFSAKLHSAMRKSEDSSVADQSPQVEELRAMFSHPGE